jgi:hypothetical protein
MLPLETVLVTNAHLLVEAPQSAHAPLPLHVLPRLPVAPQLVLLPGNTHAPVASQSVAPHAPPIGLHVAAQQCVPVPATPQLFGMLHWSFELHAAPALPFATHVPFAPGLLQNTPVPWQSASEAHAVLHAVALAQTKPPAQGAAAPDAAHVPAPLQVAGVSCPLLHDPGQLVPLTGNTQAPPALQSVAPHAPPTTAQVAAQQWVPVPDVPQTLAAHWSFAAQVAPAPPLATQVPDAPGFAQ